MTELASVQVPLDTIPISPDVINGEESLEHGGEGYDDGNPITVFHDNANFNVKHPLMNKWTLWFTKPPTGKVSSTPRDYDSNGDISLTHGSQNDNWNELLKQVISFDSVEEFWGIYVSPIFSTPSRTFVLTVIERTTSALPRNSPSNQTTTSSNTASSPNGRTRRTSTAANGRTSSKTRKPSPLTISGCTSCSLPSARLSRTKKMVR